MPEAAKLLEIHRRTHSGTITLLEHCAKLSDEELHRRMDGFGYPSIHHQLHHIIEGEDYWIGVLRSEYAPGGKHFERAARIGDEEVDESLNFAGLPELAAYRERVAAETAAFLAAQSAEQLATAGEYCVWGGKVVTLTPWLVVLRPITHTFHHRGQIAVMCRLLGQPVPPSPALDFPLRG